MFHNVNILSVCVYKYSVYLLTNVHTGNKTPSLVLSSPPFTLFKPLILHSFFNFSISIITICSLLIINAQNVAIEVDIPLSLSLLLYSTKTFPVSWAWKSVLTSIVSPFNNKIFAVDSSIKRGEYGELLLFDNYKFYRATITGDLIPISK